MEYAVIISGGKQYKVTPGDILEVAKIASDENTISFDALLSSIDGNLSIGNPTVPNVKVLAKVLGQTKGEKIRISQFKAKARYRRTIGFRAKLTQIQIESIEMPGKAKKVEQTEKVVKVEKAKVVESKTPKAVKTPKVAKAPKK